MKAKKTITFNPDKKDYIIQLKKTNWWWLLLLFIPLLFLLFFLKKCESSNTYLPDKPGVIVPIDSNKIVNDPDSIRKIVSDRLNIALLGDNNDIYTFAKRFKEVYKGKNYEIIYYDTVTYRLQIQIPAEEREKIKAEIKTKFPEYKMLVWDESLFQNNYKPNDPGFSDINQSWYFNEVKAAEAWDISLGDSSIIIAIIDDGFDLSHPEFQGKIFKPWNVPTHSPNVNTGKKSVHGTHVAATAIGNSNNKTGVSGIAPNCKFMPIQVGDYDGLMSMTYVIDGILYAIHNGADVVNMSLGLMALPDVANLPINEQKNIVNNFYKDEELFWDELFKAAYDKNIIFVLAGGNQNVLIGLDPMQRSKYNIKVSAVAPKETKAQFSNFGDFSTISAPGVHIYNAFPNNTYEFLDGTSMASPVVTGGIALIKSVNPALSFEQVVDLIQSTGIPVSSPNAYVGNIIQLDKALGVADNNRKNMPKVECPDVQNKIDSLLLEIEKLRQICMQDSATNDTLKIPEDENNSDFAIGKWKSTTYIYNEKGEQVTIYFDFYKDGKGKITLVEPNNTQCTNDLSLSLSKGEFKINQTGNSICNPPPKQYEPYTFICKPDENGCAECIAKNKIDKNNEFSFKLVKVN